MFLNNLPRWAIIFIGGCNKELEDYVKRGAVSESMTQILYS